MEDYPETLRQFETRFSTEEGCREYLFQLRWPEGFRCPRCGGGKAWAVSATLFQCSGCDRQTSVTAGTVFQDTRKPLTIWFRAMWHVTSQKNGASALGLQRVLGLGSYRTAWSWLHKLRRAMVRPGRDRLTGWVEVDETYVGGLEEGVAGRGAEDKALIVIAAQADGKRIGRIRMQVIQDASAASLHPFVKDCIEPGSTVHTDGWQGYAELKGYDHEVTKIRGRRKEASTLLPRVHLVASLLKRWLDGTHQGAVSHKHLPYYLDEFTFRFNRRRCKSRGKLFYRLVLLKLGKSEAARTCSVPGFFTGAQESLDGRDRKATDLGGLLRRISDGPIDRDERLLFHVPYRKPRWKTTSKDSDKRRAQLAERWARQ